MKMKMKKEKTKMQKMDKKFLLKTGNKFEDALVRLASNIKTSQFL